MKNLDFTRHKKNPANVYHYSENWEKSLTRNQGDRCSSTLKTKTVEHKIIFFYTENPGKAKLFLYWHI